MSRSVLLRDPAPSEEPLVTIGLAVYNGEAFLSEALASLVGQSYSRLEILVADNASTDATAHICREFARRDERVRILRSDRNRGAAWNFSRLPAEAAGRYFRWAAADDVVLPDCVARSVEVLEARSDVVLVYPKTLLVDEVGRPIEAYEDRLHIVHEQPSERFRELRRRIGLCNAFYGLIRTDALRRTGLLGTCPAPDIVLLSELALHGKIVELPDRMFLRRFHEEAASAKHGSQLEEHYGVKPGGVERPPLYLHRWGRVGPTFQAILRSPVPVEEKLRASGITLMELVRARHELARELAEAGGYLLDVLGDRFGLGTDPLERRPHGSSEVTERQEKQPS